MYPPPLYVNGEDLDRLDLETRGIAAEESEDLHGSLDFNDLSESFLVKFLNAFLEELRVCTLKLHELIDVLRTLRNVLDLYVLVAEELLEQTLLVHQVVL